VDSPINRHYLLTVHKTRSSTTQMVTARGGLLPAGRREEVGGGWEWAGLRGGRGTGCGIYGIIPRAEYITKVEGQPEKQQTHQAIPTPLLVAHFPW